MRFALFQLKREPSNPDKPWGYMDNKMGPMATGMNLVLGLKTLVTDEYFGIPMEPLQSFVPERVIENNVETEAYKGMNVRQIISRHDPECMYRADPKFLIQ